MSSTAVLDPPASETAASALGDDVVYRADLLEVLDISLRTLERWVAEGKFPAPIAWPGQAVVWRRSAVRQWFASLPARPIRHTATMPEVAREMQARSLDLIRDDDRHQLIEPPYEVGPVGPPEFRYPEVLPAPRQPAGPPSGHAEPRDEQETTR